MQLNDMTRPVTHSELAARFGMSPAALTRFCETHGIHHACLINRTRCYGPTQIRRTFSALKREAMHAVQAAG